MAEEVATRICTGCGEEKLATPEFFYVREDCRGGLNTRCKECVLSQAKKYNREHRADGAARMRKYYAANPEKFKKATREWRLRNPEKAADTVARSHRRNLANRAAIQRRYEARKVESKGTHTGADVVAQYEAQKGRCFYCGEKVGQRYHVDHVTPLSKGGSNGPENLVVACPGCNCRKHAKHPMDFAGIML